MIRAKHAKINVQEIISISAFQALITLSTNFVHFISILFDYSNRTSVTMSQAYD